MSHSFFDLQVNGYAGVDFNSDNLSVDEVYRACLQLKEDGVKGILATIITAEIGVIKKRLRFLSRARQEDSLIQEIIAGIHIEGPFLLNQAGYRGAHSPRWIQPANLEIMKSLLDAADGLTRIVTLAPECDSDFAVTQFLAKNGICVSAGHCNPDLETLHKAIDAGVQLFTHLGNGCPANVQRHDNIIERVLSLRKKISICFIADGTHIPFFTLRNYLDLVGYDNSIIVTDAIAAAAAPPGNYMLAELNLEVGTDQVVREPGKENFAGSAVTMRQSYENLIDQLGCTQDQAYQLTNKNPLKFIDPSKRIIP
ncbi:MAG: N-acetylglucosamine-6-phosphate deacetylase [Calditrichaeota bacterium]|nr:MAG: N-acetylglucosamine-6-phosphate deacetylase [Calditrichota bacterium]